MVGGALGLLLAGALALQPSSLLAVQRRDVIVTAMGLSLGSGISAAGAMLPLCESDEDTQCRRPFKPSNMGGKTNPNQAATRAKLKKLAYEEAKQKNEEAAAKARPK